MSDAEPVKTTDKVSPITGYGAVSSLFLGTALFFLPQMYVGILLWLLSLIGIKLGSSDVRSYFVVNLLVAVCMVGLLRLIIRPRKHRVVELFGTLRKKWHLLLVPVSFGAYFVTLMVVYALAEQFVTKINLDQEQLNPFKSASAPWEVALAFVGLVIVAPIAEELLFRGFMYQGLKARLPKFGAAVVVSVLFGLAHGQINVAIDTFVLSMFLVLLVEKTGSLVPAILLHATKNLLAFVIIFFVK